MLTKANGIKLVFFMGIILAFIFLTVSTQPVAHGVGYTAGIYKLYPPGVNSTETVTLVIHELFIFVV